MEGSSKGPKQGDKVYHDGQLDRPYEVEQVHGDGSVVVVSLESAGAPGSQAENEDGAVSTYSAELFAAHFSAKPGRQPSEAGLPDDRGSHFPPS